MSPRDRRDSDGVDEFGGSTRLQHADSIRTLLDEMASTEDDKRTREMDPDVFRALLGKEQRAAQPPENVVAPPEAVTTEPAPVEANPSSEDEPAATPPSRVPWRTWALLAVLVAVAAVALVLRT